MEFLTGLVLGVNTMVLLVVVVAAKAAVMKGKQ